MSASAPRPGLALLPNLSMRARRRPGAILALWAFETSFAWALAWPFVAVVRAAYGGHPHGDAVLWEPGGRLLLDLLTRRLSSASALLAHGLTIALIAVVLGLLPLGAVLASLAFGVRVVGPEPLEKPRLSVLAMQASIIAFRPLLGLLGLTLIFQLSLVAASIATAGLAAAGFERKLGENGAFAIAAGILGAGAVTTFAAGILQDVARAAVIRFRVGAAEGLRAALQTLSRAPLPLLWSWTWRSLASLVPVAFAAVLAGRLGGRGGTALLVLAGIHQLAVLARVALRTSWLARALRAVDAGPYRVTPR